MKRFVTFLLLCYVCVSCSKNTDSMSLDIYVNDVKAEREINKYIYPMLNESVTKMNSRVRTSLTYLRRKELVENYGSDTKSIWRVK